MERTAALLEEDRAELLAELRTNWAGAGAGGVAGAVQEAGSCSLALADKLRVHVAELESVTSLATVLRVRLKTAHNKMEVTKDQREKVILNTSSASDGCSFKFAMFQCSNVPSLSVVSVIAVW